MTTPTAHTPLEKLFLYRLVIQHQITEQAFVEISRILRDNKYLQDEPGFNEARLTPEALRGLFFQILRDELAGDDAKSNGEKASGSPSPSSRKRKLPAPLPSTLKEACAHAQTIVSLLDKLYNQYTDWRVRAVQHDDQRLAQLQDEIAQLEELERAEEEERKTLGAEAAAGQHTAQLVLTPAENLFEIRRRRSR